MYNKYRLSGACASRFGWVVVLQYPPHASLLSRSAVVQIAGVAHDCHGHCGTRTAWNVRARRASRLNDGQAGGGALLTLCCVGATLLGMEQGCPVGAPKHFFLGPLGHPHTAIAIAAWRRSAHRTVVRTPNWDARWCNSYVALGRTKQY